MAALVAVISDSHVGQRISAYPGDLLNELEKADLVIHAGDHSTIKSVETLRERVNLKAVHGNMDEIAVTSALPAKLIFEIEGLTIGVAHGWGPPVGLAKKVRGLFEEEPPDIIIFGHSHRPTDKVVDSVRMLNPGSLSGNLGSSGGSWAKLTLEGGDAEWEEISIDI